MRTSNHVDPVDFVSRAARKTFNCEPVEIREIRKHKLYALVLPDRSSFHIKLARFLRDDADPGDWWNAGRFRNELAYVLAATAAIPDSVCRLVAHDWNEQYFITETAQPAPLDADGGLDPVHVIDALKTFALSVHIERDDPPTVHASRAKSWLARDDVLAGWKDQDDLRRTRDHHLLRSEIMSVFDVLDNRSLRITMHGDVCLDNVLVRNGKHILCDFEQSGNRLFHLDIASISLSFVNCGHRIDISGYPIHKIESDACRIFAPQLSMRDHNDLLCAAYVYWIFVWAPQHFSFAALARLIHNLDHVIDRLHASQKFPAAAEWLNRYLGADLDHASQP